MKLGLRERGLSDAARSAVASSAADLVAMARSGWAIVEWGDDEWVDIARLAGSGTDESVTDGGSVGDCVAMLLDGGEVDLDAGDSVGVRSPSGEKTGPEPRGLLATARRISAFPFI